MKIGILTFQYAINYGAVMQMYSLQKTLKRLGHSVDVIDYVPKDYCVNGIRNNIYNSGLKVKHNKLSNSVYRIFLNMRHQRRLVRRFDEFLVNHFSRTAHCDERNWRDILRQYDAVIVGSDQVWNPTNQQGDVYFLNDDSIHCKRIAYAVDSTNAFPVQNRIDDLRIALRRFSAISVRNEHTKEFVSMVLGESFSAEVVCDPVVLSDYLEFIGSNQLEDYALVYILGKEIPGGHAEIIKDIREKNPGIRIIQVVMIKQRLFPVLENVDEHIYDCSPEKWVDLIYHCKFIYTDSFHCILFAMKYHKNFLAYYCEEKRAPRLISLREHYSLGYKIVDSVAEAREKKSMDVGLDYQQIDAICQKEAEDSCLFIRNALEKA